MKTSDEENFNGKTFDGKISIEHQLVLWLNQQECILVGCVPSAAVAAGGGCVYPGGCLPMGVVCPGGV